MKCYYENRRVCFCKSGPCCYVGKESTCGGFEPEPVRPPYDLEDFLTGAAIWSAVIIGLVFALVASHFALRYLS
jgi:hypothetical protein